MATKADYLIRNTVNDCTQLRAALEQAGTLAKRVVQRMEALSDPGNPVAFLLVYEWPDGYTIEDFVALYNAFDVLPGSVVADETRDSIYKILAHFQ